MANKRNVFSIFFLSIVPLAAAFKCLGLLFFTLVIEPSHKWQLVLKAAVEYNAAVAIL